MATSTNTSTLRFACNTIVATTLTSLIPLVTDFVTEVAPDSTRVRSTVKKYLKIPRFLDSPQVNPSAPVVTPTVLMKLRSAQIDSLTYLIKNLQTGAKRKENSNPTLIDQSSIFVQHHAHRPAWVLVPSREFILCCANKCASPGSIPVTSYMITTCQLLHTRLLKNVDFGERSQPLMGETEFSGIDQIDQSVSLFNFI